MKRRSLGSPSSPRKSKNMASPAIASCIRNKRSVLVILTVGLFYWQFMLVSWWKQQTLGVELVPNNTTKATLQAKDAESSSGRVWFAGIVRDAATDVQPSTMRYMVDLSCLYNISIHVVANSGIDECRQARRALVKEHYPKTKCAPFHVEKEPSVSKDNRVDRIALVRDYQRDSLRKLVGNPPQPNDVIILADLDLHRLPPIAESLVPQLKRMQTNHAGPDVVCSAGVMYRPFGYYDIFATVLLEDTFVFPLSGRMIPQHYPGENASLVRSNAVYGQFTQWDLLTYLQEKGNNGEPVPVRSCFGGLTLYRASTWLLPKCNYATNFTSLIKYADKSNKRPCEHVVFHYCLLQESKATIAVQPTLRTEWNADVAFGNKMRNATRHESLQIFGKHKDEASKLSNGDYTLQIGHDGVLQVTNGTRRVWTSGNSRKVDYWTHMYLILRPTGLLELVQQVPLSLLQKHNSTLCAKSSKSWIREVKIDNCQAIVWSSGKKGKESRYVLVLHSHGQLSVEDEVTHTVLWKT